MIIFTDVVITTARLLPLCVKGAIDNRFPNEAV